MMAMVSAEEDAQYEDYDEPITINLRDYGINNGTDKGKNKDYLEEPSTNKEKKSKKDKTGRKNKASGKSFLSKLFG